MILSFYFALSIKISNCQVKFFHSVQIIHMIRDYLIVLSKRDNTKYMSKLTANVSNYNILLQYFTYLCNLLGYRIFI